MTTICYQLDPEINADVIADALEAERADLAAGYPPRPWLCICGTEHSRGHFGAVGVHRCLSCGYVGTEGVMLDPGQPGVQAIQPAAGHALVTEHHGETITAHCQCGEPLGQSDPTTSPEFGRAWEQHMAALDD